MWYIIYVHNYIFNHIQMWSTCWMMNCSQWHGNGWPTHFQTSRAAEQHDATGSVWWHWHVHERAQEGPGPSKECPQNHCDMWGKACARTHVLYDFRCYPNLDKSTEEIKEAHQHSARLVWCLQAPMDPISWDQFIDDWDGPNLIPGVRSIGS